MLSFFSNPEKDRVTKAIIPARRRRGCRGGNRGTKSAIQSRGDRRDLFVLKSFQHNRFKTPKLSKLQRYILLEAVKSLSGLAQRAEKANELRQGAVAKGLSKPGSKPVRPSDLSHITRSYILIDFFKLTLRKYRFRGWVPDRNADRMNAEITEQLRQDRAHASLYRAIKRLEAYGLIRRMPERGGLQLTELGITVAKSFESPSAISSTIDPAMSL